MADLGSSPIQESYIDEDMQAVLFQIMNLGELLLESGAEVHRVEDTIRRLCRAYGFGRTDVFTITSSIVVTAVTQDGLPITQTRRIYSISTNLEQIDRLNSLSRRLCKTPVPLDQLKTEIAAAGEKKTPNPVLTCLTYAGVSAAFSVFFGGSGLDPLAAALSGMLLYLLVSTSRHMHMNGLFQQMVCSALTGVAVMLLCRIGIGAHPDKIMIGNIMLVIPGLQLTTSLRDMLNGDIITGGLNLVEAVLKATAVAAGFALPWAYIHFV
ncbi:MAG: threonine/serine exporter family protein [Lachnospiraceae bacterium]|nr:threonine/serine exporter family protein [Lachnospiraceae bacterium]